MNNGERTYWLHFGDRQERSDRQREAVAAARDRPPSADVPLQEMNRSNPGQQAKTGTPLAASPDEGPKEDEPGILPPRPPRASRSKNSYLHFARFINSCFTAIIAKLVQEGEVKVGWIRAAFILLTEQVGLALAIAPYAFYILGYVGGAATYLALALIGYYTNMILYRHREEYGAVTSICDVARRVMGEFGKWLTFSYFTVCVVMIAAAHIREGADFLSISRDPTPAPLIWIYEYLCPSIANTVLPALLILFVALPRNLRALSLISMATVPLTIASVAGAVGVLWAEERNELDFPRPRLFGYRSASIADTKEKVNIILIVIFTFLIQPTAPMVMSDMRNISHFPKALRWSTGFQVVLLILLGSLGASLGGYGPLNGTIYMSLPNNELSVALYGMIQPSVVLQAGLFINVLGREFWQSCHLDNFASFRGKPRFSGHWFSRQFTWLFLLALLVFIAFLIAGLVPDLGNLIGLVVAIAGVYFFFILPAFALFYTVRIRREFVLPGEVDRITPRERAWTFTKSTLLFLAGVVVFTLGLWSSIDLFKHYAGSNYGGDRSPFLCAVRAASGEIVNPQWGADYAD